MPEYIEYNEEEKVEAPKEMSITMTFSMLRLYTAFFFLLGMILGIIWF